MRKITGILLSMIFLLSFGMNSYAAETTLTEDNHSVDIGVYAVYEKSETNIDSAPVDDGKAEITLPDGTDITVEGLEDGDSEVIVYSIPDTDEDAKEWIDGLTEDKVQDGTPYVITIEGEDGSQKNPDGVTITIDIPDGVEDPVVYSVDENGNVTELDGEVKDGTITFEADGSPYYVIGQKMSGADSPPDVPPTGDNSNLWLWWLLLIVSAASITVICIEQKKHRAVK